MRRHTRVRLGSVIAYQPGSARVVPGRYRDAVGHARDVVIYPYDVARLAVVLIAPDTCAGIAVPEFDVPGLVAIRPRHVIVGCRRRYYAIRVSAGAGKRWRRGDSTYQSESQHGCAYGYDRDPPYPEKDLHVAVALLPMDSGSDGAPGQVHLPLGIR